MNTDVEQRLIVFRVQQPGDVAQKFLQYLLDIVHLIDDVLDEEGANDPESLWTMK